MYKHCLFITILLGIVLGVRAADDITVSYNENSSMTLFDNPVTSGSSKNYYRIPAIAKLNDGTLMAFCDLRISKSGDIGSNAISVVCKKSTDNGKTWGSETVAVAGNGSGFDYAHGDAAVVTDRETGKMILLCASGTTGYGSNGVQLGQYYSTEGSTWTGGEITSAIKSAFTSAGLSVAKQFFTSGRIIQSSRIKVGSYYRIYSAMCTGNGSIVMYSDDFGANWAVLGSKVAYSSGDETVLEELPNGDLLLSARLSGMGRGFNVFRYSDLSTATGSWNSTTSTGISTAANCNGEMLLLPTSNSKYYVLLHSVSLSGRNNVTVYYKLINTGTDDYTSPAFYSSGWNTLNKMSSTTSAYSTMVADKDGNVAFLMEENDVADASGNASYDIVYRNFSVNVTGFPEPSTTVSLYDDNTSYTIPENMAETVDVYLYRTSLVAKEKNGFCIPFDMTEEQLSDAFGSGSSVYSYCNYNSTTNMVYFALENEVTAGIPYILIPDDVASVYIIKGVPSSSFVAGAESVTHGDYAFCGTFADCTFSDYYACDETSGVLKYASSDRELKGFRAYFKATSASAKVLSDICFDDGGPTGICQVEKKDIVDCNRYNLLGQNVGTNTKGIVIIHGKKTVLK